ncbi:MAG: J domain-containing protein [Treponema sp.]|nr:J domain-containing protein [Treponema sp.]
MKYFQQCQSIEEAKKHYRQLLLKHHPDHAGKEGEAVTKEIISQFNAFLKNFMSNSFNSYYQDKEWKPDPDSVTPFQDILEKIIDLECEIEIIGFWIYCFNSKEVKEQLKELGFWFSIKHKAWVFSGGKKRKITSRETLDEIRASKGSHKVQKEEKEKEKSPLKIAV